MTVIYGSGPGRETDWYSVLGLGPLASAEEITTAVERMSRQASALANTAPERSQQLREVIRAIKRDLLSGAEARQRYDLSRPRPAPPVAPGPAPAAAVPPPPPPAGPPAVNPAGAAAGYGYTANTQGAGLGSRFKRFMQTSWTCPACGEGAMPDDRFCKACGAKIVPPAAASRPAPAPETSFCGSCGKHLGAQEDFCTRCGTRRA